MSAIPIDKLLATEDDFELCNGVFGAIVDVMGNKVDATLEPEPCRTVTLVWHSVGIIDNGGFQYLFEGDFQGDHGYRITTACYQRIHAKEAYAAFQDAFALFSNNELPSDIDERLRIYQSHPEDRRDAIDNRFFGADDDTLRLLAEFIRSNKDAIGRFLSERLWAEKRKTV